MHRDLQNFLVHNRRTVILACLTLAAGCSDSWLSPGSILRRQAIIKAELSHFNG